MEIMNKLESRKGDEKAMMMNCGKISDDAKRSSLQECNCVLSHVLRVIYDSEEAN
jgi:hypothetical protein